ncbi:MAG: hypothetical protein JNN05_02970 [Candidatus Omnitrophica bacterium]|nr:hypothetical protein [Candidatus Omnitrophota bacterium]
MLAFSFPQNPFALGSDTYEFWHLASNLLNTKQFIYTDVRYYPLFDIKDMVNGGLISLPVLCTARVPGYPFLLAMLRSFWDSPWIGLILNFIFYIGICLYGFAIGHIFLKSKISRNIYAILLVFSPLYFTRWGLGADVPAALFLTGFTYHALRAYIADGSRSWHFVMICFWGIWTCLTRTNLFIFVLLLLLGLCSLTLIHKKGHKTWQWLAILMIIFSALGLWAHRNQLLTGHPVISTQGGFVLYAVHLSYDIQENHPLYYWYKQGRKELMAKELANQKTFNQAEEIIDQKLKSVVMDYYHENPIGMIKNWTECLRTFFLFSYYDISDILIYAFRSPADRAHFLETEHYQSLNPQEQNIHTILFAVSRLYKIGLALGFFLFPLLLVSKKSHAFFNERELFVLLFLVSLAAVLATAFFTGAGGDRLRLPFNVFTLIFSFVTWLGLIQLLPSKVRV